MFVREDIVQRKSFIGVVAAVLGLTGEGRLRYARLFAAMFVSLAVLSIVALLEGRFFYGSVTRDVDGVGTVLGMSFLGDTMVWPFVLLVPLCLILTLKAVDRTASLLNLLCRKVEEMTQTCGRPDDYDRTIADVRRLFAGRIGSADRARTRLIWLTPWVVAAIFWVYNTATCTLNQVDLVPYPYTATEVIVLDDGGRRTVALDEALDLPKWDTDIANAPGSTLITRLWTLIFYSIAPFLVFKLIQMTWGLSFFIKRFRSWIDDCRQAARHSKTDQGMLVNPFDEDGYGGLATIAEAGMGYFYVAISLVLLVLMSFFKEGTEPSWHNYVLMVTLIPAALVVFVIPVRLARDIMQDAKRSYAEYTGKRLNRMFRQLDRSLQNPAEAELGPGFHSSLSALKMFHDQVDKMPVWPFSSSVVLRIALVMLAPFSGILIEIARNLLFG